MPMPLRIPSAPRKTRAPRQEVPVGRRLVFNAEPHLEEVMSQIVAADSVLLQQECLVCLTSYQAGDVVLRLPCLHVTHEHCLLQWLRVADSKKCILCQTEFQ